MVPDAFAGLARSTAVPTTPKVVSPEFGCELGSPIVNVWETAALASSRAMTSTRVETRMVPSPVLHGTRYGEAVKFSLSRLLPKIVTIHVAGGAGVNV